MAEDQCAERGGHRQWDSLGQIRTDQLVGSQHGIEEEQEYDHQRPRADRGEPDDQSADHADDDGGQRPHGQVVNDSFAVVAPASVQDIPQHHRRSADQQGRPEDLLDLDLGRLGVSHEVENVGTDEGHRH